MNPEPASRKSKNLFLRRDVVIETSFGYFARFKLTEWNLINDQVRVLYKPRRRDVVSPREAFYKRMLDAANLPQRETTELPLEAGETISIHRFGDWIFKVNLNGFLDYSEAEIGDILEIHFRVINGIFEKVELAIVDLEDRRVDINFADIVMQTALIQNDPIWRAGAALIEKALRLTNPEDPMFSGHQTGSLSFWSYRSYNAQEEIYVQWRWNSVGELYVEAVSNKYAWPKIPVDGINHLLETGWSGPSDDEEEDLPNYFRTYEEVDAKIIADELMKVFRDVYFIKRDWIWLFQPFHLVERLLSGRDEDDFRFKPDAFFIYDEEQTFKRRCEMGVQLSEDVIIPSHLRPLS
ncbi:MAG: hypothetical protein RLZZ330_9 [Actinomycetota bacterium]|jgi:hypothetical protein